eukprot:3321465-Rhodomonas_salina.1
MQSAREHSESGVTVLPGCRGAGVTVQLGGVWMSAVVFETRTDSAGQGRAGERVRPRPRPPPLRTPPPPLSPRHHCTASLSHSG